MTEKSLLLKCDSSDRYFIVGTDFPSARVFDTTTSALAAVVELPLRSRTVSLAALTLASVAIQRIDTEARPAGAAPALNNGTRRSRSEQLLDDKVATYYAAVGLSNGTLLLHDVRRDVLLTHVQVSETQQPLISVRLCGDYAFCLAANHTLYVVHLRDAAAGPCLRVRVQPDASSIAVTAVCGTNAGNAATAHRSYRVMVAGPTNALYEVRTLAFQNSNGGGSTGDKPQVHAARLLAFPSQGSSAEFAWVGNQAMAADGEQQGLPSLPAVTASAQDGVVRVWDLQHDAALVSHNAAASLPLAGAAAAAASNVVARCRRTLLCGQRILNLSVLPHIVADPSDTDSSNRPRQNNYIMVTTLTGSVLLWSLGDALLPPVVEPVPLKPDVVLVSAVPAGRLLFGALRLAQQSLTAAANAANDSSTAASAPDALRKLELTLLRGRFAMPVFETKNIGDAVAASAAPGSTNATSGATASRRATLATLALGVAGDTAITVVELPLSSASESALSERQDVNYLLEHTTDAATSSFVVMDTVWAAHQQQVAAKASQSMTEAFKAPQLYHAKSIQDLPVKQLTLEQRLQQVAREEAAAAAKRRKGEAAAALAEEGGEAADELAGRSVLSHHALGLATIPLYQALHANDTSAVMDLLNMSARSAEGMRATVLSLQLPYCLQLLQVISERLGLCSKAVERAAVPPAGAAAATAAAEEAKSTAAPQGDGESTAETDKAAGTAATPAAADAPRVTAGVLRGGVAAFSIRSSLLEWLDAIVNYRGSELVAVQREWNARAARKAAGVSTPEDDQEDVVSPPKDFLAPVLHHYQSLCSQYDKLAVLYGRLSIFKAVRPSQRNEFMNIPRQSLASNIEMARPALSTSGGGAGSGSSAHKRRLHLADKSSVVGDDIIFPVMFKESRARSGHRVVRVRSKLEIMKKRQARENKDAALQKRARALAKEQLRAQEAKGSRSILDDDDHKKGLDVMDQIMMEEMKGGDGELDLNALEAMDLDDGSDLSEGSEGEEEEEEVSDVDSDEAATSPRRKGKKTRTEAAVVDEMLADDGDSDADAAQEEDNDAGLDSSEAEFSSGSDDEVHSDVLDEEDSSDEEEEGEESGEEGSGDDAGSNYSSADDDDADHDGMGEDMQELLTRHEDDNDRTERRKSKKVRTD